MALPASPRALPLVLVLALVACTPARVEPAPSAPHGVDPPSAAADGPEPSRAPSPAAPPPASSTTTPVTPPPAFDAATVQLERFAPEDAWVVRGAVGAGQALLFGGQCAQPQFYADAIKVAAARRRHLVTLGGDKPCNGAFRGWTFDLRALSARIARTFRALGLGEPRDVLVIGYSQGASVAERLAEAEPDTFTRFVLIAHPREVTPARFARARAVVTMAGTLDRQDLMMASARKLAAAGVRARYVPLPGAAHGYLGVDPEGTFDGVLGWLDQPDHERP